MSCHSCARTTLSLFIRSFSNAAIVIPRQTSLKIAQLSRFFTTARPPYKPDGSASQRSYRPQRTVSQHPYKHERPASQRSEDVIEDIIDEDAPSTRRERPAWAVQKAALKEKLGGEAWNPRKKLSPDTMEGIRHLHTTQPAKFTTPVLAEHFKVTPEAIRRILKSKWRPSDEEYEARMLRWNKRGERIWTDLVEMGVRPPKQWRDMGVGRATNGERPKWKSRPNMVHVRDSASDNFVIEEGEIIPVVDGSGKSKRAIDLPLSQRL